MAKKGKKSKHRALKRHLLFELYGILTLTFSIIALAGQGVVGRTLIFLCFVFLGKTWGYLIPLIFIYIGLHFMIKRVWPNFRTMRSAGIALFIMGLAITQHISLFQSLPTVDLDASTIWNVSWNAIKDGFQSPTVKEGFENVGGGLVGAFLYTVLFFLFDNAGAKLIEIMLFVIGAIMATGLSIVEAGGKLRGRFDGVGGKLKERFTNWARMRFGMAKPKATAAGSVAGGKSPVAYNAPDPDDEYDDEFEDEAPRRAPGWLKKLQAAAQPKPARQHETPAFESDEDEDELPLAPARRGAGAAAFAGAGAAAEKVVYEAPAQPAAASPAAEPGDELPVIRNFADHRDTDASPAEEAVSAIAPDGGDAGDLDAPLGASAERRPGAKPYELPSFSLLAKLQGGKGGESADYMANAKKLEATLESFGVRAKVLQVVRGPAVTRYEIQPDVGVKVSRIVSLTDDIALALAAKDIRMEAPIPGKSAIGIEVPNTEVSVVTLREVMETPMFTDASSRLTVALGRDISGQPIVGNLAKMPHLLVAGATGSGKSVCVNGIIASILFKAKPNEVKFMMIDPKMVELNVYNGIPHLLAPVVTDPRRASLALKKIVVEMERRYDLFAKSGTRNIEGYNALLTDNATEEPLPYIVVIVDELADLMMVASHDVEDAICRLAQMARAAGIHLIIATQRPSVDVITGLIKANIPSRIAFGVSSQVDSRTILDMVGAEKLLGRGDMLYLPVGASKPVRVQGAFLSDQEVESVVTFCRSQEKAEYQEGLVPEVEEAADAPDEQEDELFDQAVQIILESKQASVSLLQRRMRIGYTRAARLIDYMEARGIIGPYEGSKPREVLMSLEQYNHNRIPS